MKVGISPHAPYTVSQKLLNVSANMHFQRISNFIHPPNRPMKTSYDTRHRFSPNIMKDSALNGKARIVHRSISRTHRYLRTKPLLVHCVTASDSAFPYCRKRFAGSSLPEIERNSATDMHLLKISRSGNCGRIGERFGSEHNVCDLLENRDLRCGRKKYV